MVTPLMQVRLHPDPRLRKANNGEFLIGGSPATLLRLSEAGAARVRSWFEGAPVGASPAEINLASRLTRTGMARTVTVSDGERSDDDTDPHEAGDSLDGASRYVIIVPVYNDHEGLQATLDELGERRIIVVDNGSDPPVEIAQPNVEVVRTPRPTSPADARNEGLRHMAEELKDSTLDGCQAVAFLDAGVAIDGSDLDALVERLGDPIGGPVLAVAPRVRSKEQRGALGEFERHSSPLDLGPEGGDVAPGRPLSYVPSACLVVSSPGLRSCRLESGEWFDSELRFGEDVDLVWRLAGHGTVRYLPDVEALHPPRSSLSAFIRQRIGYGSAAGPLGVRHGEHITPFRTSPWGAAVAAAVFSGHALVAVGIATASVEMVRRRLPTDLEDRSTHALRLVGSGHRSTVLALAGAAVRPWWPLTLLLSTRAPHAALRLLGVAAVRRLFSSRHENLSLIAPIDVGLGLVDDLAYGIGVWRGCVSAMSVRALVPTIRRSIKEQ